MLKLIALIVFLVNLATLSVAQLRIIGGKPARDGQFPYQVSLQYNGEHKCGGSILASNLILTAAHCVVPKEIHTLTVVAGITNFRNRGRVTVDVQEYFMHSKYNPEFDDYDAAILKLKESLPIGSNSKIQSIKLVDKNVKLREGDTAIVSGWGRNKPLVEIFFPEYIVQVPPYPEHLQYATVLLWDNKRCSEAFPSLITANMICAKSSDGKADACELDSGGPLVVNGTLAGIVSFGPNCENPEPGVYTNVAAIRSWIKQVSRVKKHFFCCVF